MPEPLTLKIADLRMALTRARDATQGLLGSEVTIDIDYYWHLPVEDAFNMAGEPSVFTVGQVSDDLGDAVQDTHERVPEEVWHDLSHFIGVLRALELATCPA